ncbi:MULTISPECIES: hypothetical protein [Falsihalocynthiibacter]|uniref:hypothetical protein n=1 Tax=Falsihalocynthiibacter TaxID=2854182 RepID=UPI0030021D3D
MDTPTRTFVAALGGYQAVAGSLKKKPQTVHTAMQSGSFPASWYIVFCALAQNIGIDEPPRSMFSFVELAGLEDAK